MHPLRSKIHTSDQINRPIPPVIMPINQKRKKRQQNLPQPTLVMQPTIKMTEGPRRKAYRTKIMVHWFSVSRPLHRSRVLLCSSLQD